MPPAVEESRPDGVVVAEKNAEFSPGDSGEWSPSKEGVVADKEIVEEVLETGAEISAETVSSDPAIQS